MSAKLDSGGATPAKLRVITRSALQSNSWSPGINLGRPTLRGVRKCPKCGTINGTRGTSCKNIECRVTFSRPAAAAAVVDQSLQPSRKNKTCFSPEAVRIITGSVTSTANEQVYSVRVRNRGPDYRGFVQLPNLSADGAVPSITPATITDQGEEEEAQVNKPHTTVAIARCFVDTCVRFASESANEVQPDTCQHVKATLCCDAEAVPLILKNTVLNGLQLASEVKQAIWSLATESPGPLVQRVSKTVMVVKCQVDPRHPLGFLHFSIYETAGVTDISEKYYKFICTCKEFRTTKSSMVTNENNRRCVHFYACICAFASDEKLSKEFSHYINTDKTALTEMQLTNVLGVDAVQQLIVESHAEPPIDGKAWEVVVVSADFAASSSSKKPNEDGEVEGDDLNKRRRGKHLMTLRPPISLLSANESKACVMFVDWLASVTERVNQTMHYGCDGRPEPLVFLVPQHFFDNLQQRIAAAGIGNKNTRMDNNKRRLPNIVTTFERTSPPLGFFSKYTWHINNLSQVQRILDTPHITLEVIRYFVEKCDGTYDVASVPSCTKHSSFKQSRLKSDPQPRTQPLELKTFLKVGYTNSEEKLPTSFIIDWIPDILPKSKIGELSLRFEYGHQRNGQIELKFGND